MPEADFTSTRLFVDGPLSEGGAVVLDGPRLNYLANVLRFRDGDGLLVFDGISGEFAARFVATGKRTARLDLTRRTRPQPPAGDVWLLFAPLKHARLDYMVQKAVEMGASRLCPVITHRTQAARVNLERMRANVVEAAEQCGVLAVPEVVAEAKLDAALAGMGGARRVIFCDEGAAVANPLEALRALPRGPLAVLIGPEGGFDEAERRALLARPCVTAIALGPRILRADTAAVAALAIVQAVLGDWGQGSG